jgi:hypothetical protein
VFCHQCAAAIEDTAEVCSACGARVVRPRQVAAEIAEEVKGASRDAWSAFTLLVTKPVGGLVTAYERLGGTRAPNPHLMLAASLSRRVNLVAYAVASICTFLAMVIISCGGLRIGDGETFGVRPEADRAARLFMEMAYAKCGDSYFATTPWVPGAPSFGDTSFGTGMIRIGGKTSVQIKGLTVSAEAAPLSDVDRMNGYEWKGAILIRCQAMRAHSFGRWSEWEEGCGRHLLPPRHVRLPLFRKEGQWFVAIRGAVPLETYHPVKTDCSNLPSAESRR